MIQRLSDRLAIELGCPTNVTLGQVVRISDDLLCAAINAEAQMGVLGTVVAHKELADKCTVETRYRERRDDREAEAAIGVGPFVWGATGKAVAYSADAAASVVGTETGPFVVVAAAGGTTTGTEAGPVTVVLNTSDKLKLKVGAGASQTVTLTAGAGVTVAAIAVEINAQTTDLTAAVDGDGYLTLTADVVTNSLEVEAIANDAYTLLGLTAAVYPVTAPTDKVKITIGSGTAQTFTLTPGSRTIAQIVADFSTGTGFTASDDDGHLKLTVTDITKSLIIGTVTGNAYTALGLTAGTTTGAGTYSPAAIAGLVIKGTQPLSFAGGAPGPWLIESGVNDAFTVKVEGGANQAFTLTAGTARTAAQVAAEIDAVATDFTPSDENGYLKLTADLEGVGIEIVAVANDAYDTLGFTVGAVAAPMGIETLEK